MTKNRGFGYRWEASENRVKSHTRLRQSLPEPKIAPESHYSISRHFEATRGDRVPLTYEIMPDGQTYSNFATWTSANTSAVTFKLMSIGMLDRTNVTTNVRTTEFIIG